MTPELEVYLLHTDWLLREIRDNLESASIDLLVARPPVALEANNLLAIAKHVVGVTRAYVLGIGCGMEVSRDRSTEFVAGREESETILADLRSLANEIPVAFNAIDLRMLDLRLVPSKELFGTGDPREMSGRDAIVNNIRHLGIHLGEIRLTRSLLTGRHGR